MAGKRPDGKGAISKEARIPRTDAMGGNAPKLSVLVVTGLESPPNVLVRSPNLVKIMQREPVPNDLLLHLVETNALQ